MSFFENTRKPQGFGGKLMTKMMNSGHSRLSQWGFSNISVNPDAEVLDVASDDKWTKIIDGMKIYNCEQLVTALKEAGFMEIKPYADAKKHWLCIVATK